MNVIGQKRTKVHKESKALTYKECPQFWTEHYEKGDGEYICGMYGICLDHEAPEGSFKYMIADDYVPSKEMPDKFETVVIPENTWAVFPCKGPMPEALQKVNTQIFSEWLPVRGDIPIFIDLDATRASLAVLEKLSGIETFYPAWDQTYSAEMMRNRLADAEEIVNELERTVCELDCGMELSAFVAQICEKLHMPMWKNNPLFARTIACCRRKESSL